jgi:hypothetical protein
MSLLDVECGVGSITLELEEIVYRAGLKRKWMMSPSCTT